MSSAKLLLVIFGIPFVIVAVVVALIWFNNQPPLSFSEELEREVHAQPQIDEGISFESFDIAPNGEDLYFIDANFVFDGEPIIFVLNIESNEIREFLRPAGGFGRSAVSVIDDETILVFDDGREDVPDTVGFYDPAGNLRVLHEPVEDRDAACSDVLTNPDAFTYFGYRTAGLGEAELMRIYPSIAISNVERRHLSLELCDDETIAQISENNLDYPVVNETNFTEFDTEDEANILRYSDQSDVSLAHPQGSFTFFANFDCERFADFVVAVDDRGYSNESNCVHSITELSTSLRFAGELFVIESDEIVGLS